MQNYEAMIVLQPHMSQNQIAEFIDKTKKFISDCKGQIISEEVLGRKKLSHEIKKTQDGFYVHIKFKVDPDTIGKLSSHLKLNELTMRSMIVKAQESKKVLPVKQRKP